MKLKRKIVALAVILLSITACGASSEQQLMQQQQQRATVDPVVVENNYVIIDLDGVRCVVSRYTTASHPIACDWSNGE